MTDGNPFAPPDDGRLAASSSAPLDPEAVLARYEGPGKGAERWSLSLTADCVVLEQEGADRRLARTRAEVAEELHIGTVSGQHAMLMLRGPEQVGLRMPREAADHLYRWLGAQMQTRLRSRLMRNGWGSTLAVGLVFLVPMDLPALANGLGMLAGATLVAAALVSRFTGNRVGFVLRAVGWAMLAAQMAYGVVLEARSPWMLAISGLLLWGVMRYVRLYGLLAPTGAEDPQGV